MIALDDIPISPLIASLPKADLHIHQEERARLDRVVARHQGRTAHDWRDSARRLMTTVPAGIERLNAMYLPDETLPLDGIAGSEPDYIVAKIVDVLEEAAADGACYVEIRFGPGGQAISRPDFMELFREAERRVQAHYPQLCAEATGFLAVDPDRARQEAFAQHLESFLSLAKAGLSSIDLIVSPYNSEAAPSTWQVAYDWAARAADAGLGVTMHAGEFSASHLAGALRVPGLTRIGHGTYLPTMPDLLEEVIRRGITVECCPSCNVVLGAVPSYAAHPLRQLVDAGARVTLNTDDPVRVWTTIGREYAVAAALGCTPAELLSFTRNAINGAFTTSERKATLQLHLDQWENGMRVATHDDR